MENLNHSTSVVSHGSFRLNATEDYDDAVTADSVETNCQGVMQNQKAPRMGDAVHERWSREDSGAQSVQMDTFSSPVGTDGLTWPCLSTRQRLSSTPAENEMCLQKLAGAVQTILECVGEDPRREGLLDTPERYAKAILFATEGYGQDIRELVNGAVFTESCDDMVIVKDIDIYSLCEHHMLPFVGKIHVGYIPDGRVLGLSKVARLAEMLARRLQVQERLTKQVALVVFEVLKPLGVGVVMESSHLCMMMRGVQKAGSITTTSCMLGSMRSSTKSRDEFLTLLRRI